MTAFIASHGGRMSAHTPGPWVAEDREVINPGAVLRDLRVIATVHADTADGANTRLIAAAPEVLAALEAVANPNAIDASRAPLDAKSVALALAWLTARPEFVAARAALAKARGET